MKISRLACSGIAGLPSLDADLVSSAARPHDLVVVTGAPAAGKTRLLELLLAGLEVIGPYQGIVRREDWLLAPTASARLELGIWLDPSERELCRGSNPTSVVVDFGPEGVSCDAPRDLSRLLARYDHDAEHGKREYFPEGRQPAWGERRDGLSALEQSLWRASKDPQKYSFVPRFLAELAQTPARRRVFADGLERLSATVRYAPDASRTPEACFATAGNAPVHFSALSSSEANAVLIAATAAMVGLCHSIVLLDRPELHVEPARLVAWVHGLAGLGIDNQWIVATQDPRLVQAVDPSQVVRLGRESGT